MFIILYLLLVLYGLSNLPKRKNYEYLIFAFLGIMLFYSENVPDFREYKQAYDYIGQNHVYLDTGWGWYYLCRLGNLLKLDYRFFSIIIFEISMFLINSTMKKYIKNDNKHFFVWTLYLIFPALLDAVQIRFLLTEAIIIYSVRFLTGENKRGIVYYLVLCCLATTIHTSSYFYFVLVIAHILHRERKYILWIAGITSFLMLIAKKQIYQIALLFVNANRIERYFNSADGVGTLGLFAYIATLILFRVLANSVYVSQKKGGDTIELRFLSFINSFTAVIWCIIPLTTFDTNFFRIQRPLWMLLYMSLMLEDKSLNDMNILIFGKKWKAKEVVVCTALLGLIFYICVFNFNVVQAFLF